MKQGHKTKATPMGCDNSGPPGIPRLSTQKLTGFGCKHGADVQYRHAAPDQGAKLPEVPPHLQRYPQPSPGHAREDRQGPAPPGPSGPTGELELGCTELR